MTTSRWRASGVAGVLLLGWLAPASAVATASLPPLCQGKAPTTVGTERDDNLRGTNGIDIIAGLGGNDTIRGRGGNDVICGAADDWRTNGRHDVLDGGRGNDTLVGSYRYYGLASGGPGDDDFVDTGVTYARAPRAVTVDLGARTGDGRGHDTLDRVGVVFGTRYDDTLVGLAQDVDDSECGCDYLYGERGGDLLEGMRGDDYLYGGRGDDRVLGGRGGDVLFPGLGSDRVVGGPRDDRPEYKFDDVSYAPRDRSVHIDLGAGVANGQGHDRLIRIPWATGTAAADVIEGDSAGNRLFGRAGDDVIRGKAGRDFLFGGAGQDGLIGGTDHDRADGGAERDVCKVENPHNC